MALINWDESLSVKVSEIDEQHKKLIGIINELYDAMKQGKGKDVLKDILTGLIEYTDTHFSTEEKYFDQFGYTESDTHKREHAAFVKKVSEFKDGFDNGRFALSVDIMMFLRDWLQNHIKGADMRYSKFFNDNGLI